MYRVFRGGTRRYINVRKMNVRGIVDAIHARVAREKPPPVDAASLDAALASVQESFRRLNDIRELVGQTPPAPDTLRARVGSRFVGVVQRALFWYTPQILTFHREAAAFAGRACRLLELQAEYIHQIHDEVRALRAERQHGTAGLQKQAEPGLPASFEFALQDHFRGPEEDTASKLLIWLDAIGKLSGSGGTWLDIGCGRGEWLTLASARGHNVAGIDASTISVEHCRRMGFDVQRGDALEHLENLEDASLAVITAFQVVEHLSVNYLLALVQAAARKLRPGGILALETPDPANILMGSHYFWLDPTHCRPIPAALMEFIFRYQGFSVIERLNLNPFPQEAHLPYLGIEVIDRVNSLLFGPRDYGIIGRRAT